MKRLLTYGWLLLTLLASLFVVSACQDDLPETTEVMMTFTTRAVVSDVVASNAPDEDKMKDLRVIMLRENGTVVDNHIEKGINASSVTFTFTTPIQTGGEDFTFLAVANEGSIPTELSWLNCNPGDDLSSSLSAIKAQQIGNGSAFALSDGQAIPQTKQWTVKVPQKDTYVENQQLDFVASKISVKFKNHTANEQSLSNIWITGIKPNGKGYLFEQASNDYVEEDVNLAQVDFSNVTVASGDSVIQSYYTYPVDGENFSSPTLYATWNEEKTMPLKIGENYISSLLRGQHLQIVVTLTGQGMIYHIADWVEEPTHIGSPSVNGGYDTEDWIADSDIVIGGGEEPGGGGTGEGEVTVWSGSQAISWSEGKNLVVNLSWLENAATKTIQSNGDTIEGIQMYVYFTSNGSSQMEIRQGTTTTAYNKLYINGNQGSYLGNMGNEMVSIFIPDGAKETQFNFSGINYTITKITVMK